MIVMHGLLGSKRNWQALCSKEEISSKRDCYLVEMRNHAESDHHHDHSYPVMADDILRFAD
jgi:pimeloyl-ACP methyl ester carboxylesterase